MSLTVARARAHNARSLLLYPVVTPRPVHAHRRATDRSAGVMWQYAAKQ